VNADLTEKLLTIEQFSISIKNINFEYDRNKLTKNPDQLVPMVGTGGSSGNEPLIFKVADRAKINNQTCRIKSRAANVDLKMSNPERIHIDEFLEIKMHYQIKASGLFFLIFFYRKYFWKYVGVNPNLGHSTLGKYSGKYFVKNVTIREHFRV